MLEENCLLFCTDALDFVEADMFLITSRYTMPFLEIHDSI